jgi:molybdenum cofactor sulfurtransferase
LLDAAALATTTQLELNTVQPDFTAVSFYKIFGFPDLGALIVRKAAAHTLMSRRYFGGGTVEMVAVVNDSWYALKDEAMHERLEDGTLPFHSIFALDAALTVHERLFTSMARISAHTGFLSHYLFDSMIALNHCNSAPVFAIYKDSNAVFGDTQTQGATIAFNILQPNGKPLGYADVERAANKHGIFVRSGGLCNPGGVATYLGWSPQRLRAAYTAGHRCSKPIQSIDGLATGVVRISLGAMSTKEDVNCFLRYVRESHVDVDAEVFSPESKVNKDKFSVSVQVNTKEAQRPNSGIMKSMRWANFKVSFAKMKNGHAGIV